MGMCDKTSILGTDKYLHTQCITNAILTVLLTDPEKKILFIYFTQKNSKKIREYQFNFILFMYYNKFEITFKYGFLTVQFQEIRKENFF